VFRIYQQFAQIELHVDSLSETGKRCSCWCSFALVCLVRARGVIYLFPAISHQLWVCAKIARLKSISAPAVSRLLTTQKWFVPASGPNPFNQSHYLPLWAAEKFAHCDVLSWEILDAARNIISLVFFSVISKQNNISTKIPFHLQNKQFLFSNQHKIVNKLCVHQWIKFSNNTSAIREPFVEIQFSAAIWMPHTRARRRFKLAPWVKAIDEFYCQSPTFVC
jgi:hypothetical protein